MVRCGGECDNAGMSRTAAVVAFDPGRNIGVAWLDSAGRLLSSRVVELGGVAGLELPEGAVLVAGDGTGSAELLSHLKSLGMEAELVDEEGSSLEGSELYWQANPPAGFMRMIPAGMRPRPPGLDAWAAYALGRRWLVAQQGHNGNPAS